MPGKEGPILLVLKGVSGNLRLLVNPELDQIVQARDLDFVESLLKDFSARAKNHPADLFKQLSSLNVGPVVTQEAGSNLSDSPDIQELCARFVQI